MSALKRSSSRTRSISPASSRIMMAPTASIKAEMTWPILELIAFLFVIALVAITPGTITPILWSAFALLLGFFVAVIIMSGVGMGRRPRNPSAYAISYMVLWLLPLASLLLMSIYSTTVAGNPVLLGLSVTAAVLLGLPILLFVWRNIMRS